MKELARSYMQEAEVCNETATNIDGNCPESSSAIREYAELRALSIGLADTPNLRSVSNSLLAYTWNSWASVSPAELCTLEGRVRKGSVLYLGGDIAPIGRISIAPFLNSSIETAPAEPKDYRFTDAAQVPSALRNESAETDLSLVVARDLDGPAIPLALAGKERLLLPFIFAVPHGAGFVICDLSARPSRYDHAPLLSRMADPGDRPAEVAPLIAADLVAGRDLSRPGSYDLVLDDRPISYDYLNGGRLTHWLSRMKELEPHFHLDCSWIPDQTWPSRRYVETLKRFDAGFVWHGFLSHIDHSVLPHPEEHLRRGKECMRRISRRFRVAIQPVMIFPMERRSEKALRCLRDAEFAAFAEFAEVGPADEDRLPPHLRFSTSLRYAGDVGFPALRRRGVRTITREQMLALATLDIPIIATVHPRDVGIRRIPGHQAECPQLVDNVLNFAREKNLNSRSLVELFEGIRKWPTSASPTFS